MRLRLESWSLGLVQRLCTVRLGWAHGSARLELNWSRAGPGSGWMAGLLPYELHALAPLNIAGRGLGKTSGDSGRAVSVSIVSGAV